MIGAMVCLLAAPQDSVDLQILRFKRSG